MTLPSSEQTRAPMLTAVSSTLSARAARRSRDLGIDRAAVPLVAGFVLLLAVAGMLGWLVVSSQRQSQLVFNAFEVQRATLRLYRVAQGTESSQRGFLLTGEARYLVPYRDLVAAAPGITEKLAEAIKGDRKQEEQFARLKDLMDRKLAELAQTIALQEDGRGAEALAVVKNDSGRELMDGIRATVDRMQAAAARDIDEEYEQAQLLGKSLLVLTLGTVFVIAALAFFVVRNNSRALASIESGKRQIEAQNEALEATVAERTAELTESNEEIQRFAYIVSHDLRSPLVNVMGFTSELEALKEDLLAGGAKPPGDAGRALAVKEFDEAIGFIKVAIDKMEGLIAAILRLSRDGRRTFKPEPVELVSLVQGLSDAQRHQLDEAGATVVVSKSLPTMVADRLALEQIFGNLLDNAIKYLDPARPGRIEVSAETVGGRARISVADNGRGIAAHDHRRVFELFRRSGEQNKRGEGIGLAHVQTLVRSLGGRITLASDLGRGSTFTVVLPLSPTSHGAKTHVVKTHAASSAT